MRISPLQMTDRVEWFGLTTENHLGAIWQTNPQKASKIVRMIQQVNFGNNIDSVLDMFPSLTLETDDDFTWELQSQSLDHYPLVECRINGTAVTPADQIGKNLSKFELVFAKRPFDPGQRIECEMNEKYPMRVSYSDPVSDGRYYIYTCELVTGDQNSILPYEEVLPGKKFSGSYSAVERGMSRRGHGIGFKSHITMQNSFSQIRIEKKSPGNMIHKKVATTMVLEDGKRFDMWQQYESYMFDMAFRRDINNLYMFGTSNRSADGAYRIKGESSYEVREGAGIRQQMETAYTSYYNQFNIKQLSSKLLDLSEGKLPQDKREFVIRTGERGAYQFHEALEDHATLFRPLQNTTRMYSVGKTGITQMGLGYGGQFVEYIGPNNIKVSLSVDSMYDDRVRNKIFHPSGHGVAESYRYDIFDIGTTEGEANIQRVESKMHPMVHRYIPGLRNPFSPDGQFAPIGTAEDAWEEHKMFIGAAIVRDPSRCVSMIPNILAPSYNAFKA